MSDIRVLVVDDSAVVRRVLGDIITEEPGLSLAGTAVNGVDALKKIADLKPDLITLDLEMPLMGGLEVLSELKSKRSRIPVVVVSSLTRKGSEATLEALSRGAADYVCKPTSKGDPRSPKVDLKFELVTRIHALAGRDSAPSQPSRGRSGSRLFSRRSSRQAAVEPQVASSAKDADADTLAAKGAQVAALSEKVAGRRRAGADSKLNAPVVAPRRKGPVMAPNAVVIGSSTGGPAALERVFSGIKAPLNVPIFIVQHIPAEFSTMLAKRLDRASGMTVVEAQDGQIAQAGTAYLAPGGQHMTLRRESRRATIKLTDGPLVNSCRPAVDVLFESAVGVYGAAQLAVILTGMGQDGLVGCQQLAQLGVPIIAQDEETCVVWGMPRFVTEQGLAEEVCPLDDISGRIIARVTGKGVKSGAAPMPRRRPPESTPETKSSAPRERRGPVPRETSKTATARDAAPRRETARPTVSASAAVRAATERSEARRSNTGSSARANATATKSTATARATAATRAAAAARRDSKRDTASPAGSAMAELRLGREERERKRQAADAPKPQRSARDRLRRRNDS